MKKALTKAQKQEISKRGRPFEKGNKMSPGRGGANPIVVQARKESKERLMSAIAKVLPMPVCEVEVLAENSSGRAADALIAAVMMKGIKTGSPMHAQFFMSYTFGRPIDYDPNEEEFIEKVKTNVEGVPKDIIVGLLKGLQNAAQSAPVPAPT